MALSPTVRNGPNCFTAPCLRFLICERDAIVILQNRHQRAPRLDEGLQIPPPLLRWTMSQTTVLKIPPCTFLVPKKLLEWAKAEWDLQQADPLHQERSHCGHGFCCPARPLGTLGKDAAGTRSLGRPVRQPGLNSLLGTLALLFLSDL